MVGASVKILVFIGVLAFFVTTTQGRVNDKRPAKGGIPITEDDLRKHPTHPSKTLKKRTGFIPPATFDAAQKWNCPSIKTIRTQGGCGTCWAVSSASLIADRLCIASNFTDVDFISGSQVAGCTYPQLTPQQNCVRGGSQGDAFRYAALNGVASGGEYNSGSGCVPYSVPPDNSVDQTCPSQCTNSNYGFPLPVDNTRHQIDSYWINVLPKSFTQSDINNQVLLMQTEIYQNGPIGANLKSFPDFENWKDPAAPYNNNTYYTGNTDHAIRITGWGQTANGISYWIIANSWGTSLGINGYFWIEMGRNVAGIESYAGAPIVDLSATISCQTSSFCSSPISQAITMNPADTNSATFLFQGNCLLQVNKKGSKISAIGAAVPIGKRIINAVSGPIVGYAIDSTGVSLNNPSNSLSNSSSGCSLPAGSTKYVCQYQGTGFNTGPQVYFNQNGVLTSYSYDGSTIWFTTGSSNQLTSVSDGTIFTSSAMSQVNAFLDIDGTNMYVFGVDANSNPLVGVLAYPTTNTNSFTWVTQPGSPANFQTC